MSSRLVLAIVCGLASSALAAPFAIVLPAEGGVVRVDSATGARAVLVPSDGTPFAAADVDEFRQQVYAIRPTGLVRVALEGGEVQPLPGSGTALVVIEPQARLCMLTAGEVWCSALDGTGSAKRIAGIFSSLTWNPLANQLLGTQCISGRLSGSLVLSRLGTSAGPISSTTLTRTDAGCDAGLALDPGRNLAFVSFQGVLRTVRLDTQEVAVLTLPLPSVAAGSLAFDRSTGQLVYRSTADAANLRRIKPDGTGDGVFAAGTEAVFGVTGGPAPSVLSTRPMVPGATCAAGGVELLEHFDLDRDRAVGTGELLSTPICNGAVGANSLVRAEPELVGTACPAGGVKLLVGVDDDRNGTLATAEVDATTVVCHAATPADGRPGLVDVSAVDPSEACPEGGVRVAGGTDLDGDGSLTGEETRTSEVVCHGRPGASTLAATSRLEPGDTCPAGGVSVSFGVDDDGDGSLSEDEVERTVEVCNGADGKDGSAGADGKDGAAGADGKDGSAGADGKDGVAALAATESFTSSTTCPAGGVRLRTGLDADRDGVLAPAEVQSTVEVCHGRAGEPGAAGCASAPAGLLALAALGLRRRARA